MNMAKKRPNIIPIIEDARHPQKYRMLVPMVDVIFAGVFHPPARRSADAHRPWHCPRTRAQQDLPRAQSEGMGLTVWRISRCVVAVGQWRR